MHNYLKLIRLIDSKEKGFTRKTVFYSILLGLLPLFRLIAPKLIIDEFNGQRRVQVMLVLAIGALILNYLADILKVKASQYYMLSLDHVNDNLAYDLNEKILKLPLEMTDSKSIQDKAQQATEGLGNLWGLFEFLGFGLSEVVVGIFSVIILIRLNPLLPLILVLLFFISKPISKKLKENEKENQKRSAEENRIYKYYFNFARDFKYSKDIKIYKAEKLILDKADYHLNQMYKLNHRYFTINGIYLGLINVINNLGILGSFIYIASKLLTKAISIADFTLYFNSINGLIEGFNQFQSYYPELARLNVTIEALFDFMDIEESWNEGGDIDEIDLSCVKIEFRNVSFKYPATDDYVLENCSFTLNPGETVALVGRNGAGKSTIVKLLCKFYEATSGEILLNGININDIDTAYYYEILSPTFQDFRLFPFRIDENVATLDHHKLNDDDYREMGKSFELLNIKNWIDNLPNAKATYISSLLDEKGVQPSGGLGQKLALARSMYHKGKFIIMDEPTSALDPRSEQEIFENMLAITKDQTSLFISHRLSSTKYADRILVCNHGHIDEVGTHDELLKNNKLYSEMFKTQAGLYS